MYSLILFYFAVRRPLAPWRPLPKFLCLKAIVFMCFWWAYTQLSPCCSSSSRRGVCCATASATTVSLLQQHQQHQARFGDSSSSCLYLATCSCGCFLLRAAPAAAAATVSFCNKRLLPCVAGYLCCFLKHLRCCLPLLSPSAVSQAVTRPPVAC